MFKRYGITETDWKVLGFKRVSSIKLENPDLYEYIIKDPPQVQHLIDRWELVLTLTVEIAYAIRRGWDYWMSVREFIQNALDASEKAHGREGMFIDIREENGCLVIIDNGPGLTFRAFILGASDKACHERGRFGEGLKVGAAFLINEGFTVYVHSGDAIYKLIRSPFGANYLMIVMGKATKRIPGTKVIIPGLTFNDLQLYTTSETGLSFDYLIFPIFVKKHPDAILVCRKYRSHFCDVVMPNFVVSHKYGDILWVRDIYVNKISEMTGGKPAYYSYNLWWVELEPNRRYADISSLKGEIKYILEHEPELLYQILLDSLTLTPEHGEITDKWLETGLYLSIPPETITHLSDYIKKKIRGNVVFTHSRAKLSLIRYFGAYPVIVPRNFSIPRMFREEYFFRYIATRELSRKPIPREVLPICARSIVNLLERLSEELGFNVEIHVVKNLMDGRASGQSMPEQGIIRLDYDLLSSIVYLPIEIMDTYIHELAHVAAYKDYGVSEDLTEEFEKSLSNIATAIIRRILTNVTVRDTLRRGFSYFPKVIRLKSNHEIFYEDVWPVLSEELKYKRITEYELYRHIETDLREAIKDTLGESYGIPIFTLTLFTKDKKVTSFNITVEFSEDVKDYCTEMNYDRLMNKLMEHINFICEKKRKARLEALVFYYDPESDRIRVKYC